MACGIGLQVLAILSEHLLGWPAGPQFPLPLLSLDQQWGLCYCLPLSESAGRQSSDVTVWWENQKPHLQKYCLQLISSKLHLMTWLRHWKCLWWDCLAGWCTISTLGMKGRKWDLLEWTFFTLTWICNNNNNKKSVLERYKEARLPPQDPASAIISPQHPPQPEDTLFPMNCEHRRLSLHMSGKRLIWSHLLKSHWNAAVIRQLFKTPEIHWPRWNFIVSGKTVIIALDRLYINMYI